MGKHNLIIFMTGAVVGSIAGYFYAYKKFLKSMGSTNEKEETKPADDIPSKPQEYEEKAAVYQTEDKELPSDPITNYYNTYFKPTEQEVQRTPIAEPGLPVIYSEARVLADPTEFGDDEDYNIVEITYFVGDDVMITEDNEVIYNRDSMFGPNVTSHFGMYPQDEDSIYVRSDPNRTYYAIRKTLGTFQQYMFEHPHFFANSEEPYEQDE